VIHAIHRDARTHAGIAAGKRSCPWSKP